MKNLISNDSKLNIKNVNKDRLKYLIEKYKHNSLHLSEYQEFLCLLNEPDSIENLDKLLTRYWKETESLRLHNAQDNISKFPRLNSSHPQSKSPASIPLTSHSHGKGGLRVGSQPQYWWTVAASLILLAGLFFYFGGTQEIVGDRELVYSTGFGERLEIQLNDGSHITLNANSKIRWNEDWEKQRNRQITLEGEAFFEVEKHDRIPFTVHTKDVAVEVLGTSFNVDSRKEKTDVYLEEGKVNLKLLGGQDTKENEPAKEIIMEPGDQIKYNAKERKVEKSEGQNIITAASWKNNVLNFKNMKFREVLDLLREIYGQSFECTDGKLLNTPMYIGVPYSDWEAVRQALELSLNIEFLNIESRRYSVRSTKNKSNFEIKHNTR